MKCIPHGAAVEYFAALAKKNRIIPARNAQNACAKPK
jgi:hypothetical protein